VEGVSWASETLSTRHSYVMIRPSHDQRPRGVTGCGGTQCLKQRLSS